MGKATNFRASHLDFLGSSFLGVNVPLKDFSNKNVLLVKSSLTDEEGVFLPKAEAKYNGVTFLYRGDTQSITPVGAENPQIFKFNCIYICEKTGSEYEWAEVSLSGSGVNWKGAVDESETIPGTIKDLPNVGVKVGDQYRVAKGGNYTTDYTVSPATKVRAQEGDFFFCNSVADVITGEGATYIKITSGDDLQIVEIPYTDFVDGELVDKEIDNELGTADVSVEFFISDSTNHKRVPILADYVIVPEVAGETGNKIIVNFNSQPDFGDKVIVKITAN